MRKNNLPAIAVCIFLLSFTQPAFYVGGAERDAWSNGVALVFFGWSGLMVGAFSCIAWLANPLFFLAIILFYRGKKHVVLVSCLSVLLAASFLLVNTIIISEAPTYARVTAIKAGYWIWLASMCYFFIGASVFSRMTRKKNSIEGR